MAIELDDVEGNWEGWLNQLDEYIFKKLTMHARITVLSQVTGEVRIIIDWPDLKNARTKSTGKVTDDLISWKEQELIDWNRGATNQPPVELGVTYTAQIVEPGLMVGTIAASKRHPQGCTFELRKQ